VRWLNSDCDSMVKTDQRDVFPTNQGPPLSPKILTVTSRIPKGCDGLVRVDGGVPQDPYKTEWDTSLLDVIRTTTERRSPTSSKQVKKGHRKSCSKKRERREKKRNERHERKKRKRNQKFAYQKLKIVRSLELLVKLELEEGNVNEAGWFAKVRDRLKTCGRWVRFRRCGGCASVDGKSAEESYSCALKICPFCLRKRSNQYAQRALIALEGMKAPKLLTLTVKNGHDLKERLEHLKGSFDRLRERDFWKDRVDGWLRFLEVTHNSKEGWHPHFHFLIDCSFLEFKKLQEAWKSVTGDSHVVNIKSVDKGGAREVSKYVLKVKDLFKTENEVTRARLLGEFLIATKDKRFYQPGGYLYNTPLVKEIKAAQKAEQKIDERLLVCECCGELGNWLWRVMKPSDFKIRMERQSKGSISTKGERLWIPSLVPD
jgi:hypothetical protein